MAARTRGCRQRGGQEQGGRVGSRLPAGPACRGLLRPNRWVGGHAASPAAGRAHLSQVGLAVRTTMQPRLNPPHLEPQHAARGRRQRTCARSAWNSSSPCSAACALWMLSSRRVACSAPTRAAASAAAARGERMGSRCWAGQETQQWAGQPAAACCATEPNEQTPPHPKQQCTCGGGVGAQRGRQVGVAQQRPSLHLCQPLRLHGCFSGPVRASQGRMHAG